jgi:hypothetical protein
MFCKKCTSETLALVGGLELVKISIKVIPAKAGIRIVYKGTIP